jgi:hypothetical protein
MIVISIHVIFDLWWILFMFAEGGEVLPWVHQLIWIFNLITFEGSVIFFLIILYSKQKT